ncbi:MAG: hypothetical protein IKM94_05105 [Alphaproteobacteria bacterium]|nr:hypothetical protein [Alphaproteobacteria bacterium]
MKRQCCIPYDYTHKIKRGQKTSRKIKIDTDNQFFKIKNISAREQLLAELAAAEKANKK